MKKKKSNQKCERYENKLERWEEINRNEGGKRGANNVKKKQKYNANDIEMVLKVKE